MRGASWRIPLVLPLVLLSGCFAGIIDEHADTKPALICMALVGDQPLVLHVWGGTLGADAGALGAAAALEEALGRVVEVVFEEAPALARGDAEAMRAWADPLAFRGRSGIHLHVLWVEEAPEVNRTGLELGPGVAAVSASAVERGAERLGVPASDVAAAVLMHHVGHALGLVNRGVPVQNPAIQEREGRAGHAADPADVMHGGWEEVDSMAWHGPYRYSDADRADWAGAREGMCA